MATVLILVLMEDTLRVLVTGSLLQCLESLNPCFNGRYSQSRPKYNNNNNFTKS